MGGTKFLSLKNIVYFLSIFAACVFSAALCGLNASAGNVINYNVTYTETKVRLELIPKDEENTIYMTFDGTKPDTKSKVYTKRISGTKPVTVRAVEMTPGGVTVASIKAELRPPVHSPVFESHTDGLNEYLTITTPTKDAEIYYTTNGSTPTESSNKYTGRIRLEEGMTVTAAAFKEEMKRSKDAVYEYVRSIYLSMDELPIYEKLMELRSEYPDGMYWNDESTYRGGSGCWAFAFLLSDKVFGADAPVRYVDDFEYDDLRVGNIVRINGDSHSVVILEVKKNSVVVAEGNYADKVSWGREISKSTIVKGDYLMTRYSDQLLPDEKDIIDEEDPEYVSPDDNDTSDSSDYFPPVPPVSSDTDDELEPEEPEDVPEDSEYSSEEPDELEDPEELEEPEYPTDEIQDWDTSDELEPEEPEQEYDPYADEIEL